MQASYNYLSQTPYEDLCFNNTALVHITSNAGNYFGSKLQFLDPITKAPFIETINEHSVYALDTTNGASVSFRGGTYYLFFGNNYMFTCNGRSVTVIARMDHRINVMNS